MAVIFKAIMTMYLMIAIGVMLYRKRILKNEAVDGITDLLIRIILPLTILNAYTNHYEDDMSLGLIISIIISLILHAIFVITAHLFFKDDPVGENAAMITNAGFIGIPLVTFLIDDSAVFYTAGFMAVSSILQWTYGESLLSGHSRFKISSLIRSPFMIAFIVGIIIYSTGIKIPDILKDVLSELTDINTPLAMIILGTYIARIKTSMIKNDLKRIMKSSVFRLLVLPLITVFLLSFADSLDQKIIYTIVILASCPAAISVAMAAKRSGSDYTYASATVCMTTVLSIFTLPFILFLYEII